MFVNDPTGGNLGSICIESTFSAMTLEHRTVSTNAVNIGYAL